MAAPAIPAGIGPLRYTADSAVPEIPTFHRPKQKTELSTTAAIVATPFFLLLLLATRGSYGLTIALVLPYALIVGAAVLEAGRRGPEVAAPRGRILRIEREFLRQFADDGALDAEIDATREFQYRVVPSFDRVERMIRLYQGDAELTFYPSDPGAKEAIRRVVQIKWPRRPAV